MSARAKKIIEHLNRAPEVISCARHTRDWLPLALSYTGLRRQKFPIVARLRRGGFFELRDFYDLATWWQIFFRKVYPVKRDDLVIIDAGANIGAFTLYALACAPQAKVISIEPFPETFSRLESAVARSRSQDRVQLINAALSSHSGWVSMQQDEMGSQFRRVVGESSGHHGAQVPARTLAEVLAGMEREVDFLKLDIEGSEYDAILASPIETLRRIRRIAMEFHPLYTPNAPQPQQIFQHLESAGFAMQELQDHGEGYGIAYLRQNLKC